MRVRVWSEQLESFEMSVLEQCAQLVPSQLEDMESQGVDLPIVLLGRALVQGREQVLRKLIAAVYRSSTFMLLVQPFGDLDLHKYLDTRESIRIVRRPPDSTLKLITADWQAKLGPDLKIRSDQFLETTLLAGLLGVDSASQPVLLRYQPRNTAGAVFLSTCQLLSYTALSVETDRETLLSAILNWTNPRRDTFEISRKPDLHAGNATREEVTAVILALAAARTVDAAQLVSFLQRIFGSAPSLERIAIGLEYLAGEGVTVAGQDGQQRSINDTQLQRTLEALDLHAYARELGEMVKAAQGRQE
jgi:hypothetical protein